ncbi:trypsin-like peptidase domain-containing protein [Mucilaginibacter paludis]|nr:trypsin-like peptidase domain-containing protein [Mucilaginibacter paludis]
MLILMTVNSLAFCQTGDGSIPFSVLAGLKRSPVFLTITADTALINTSAFKSQPDSIPVKAFQFAERTEVAITPANAGVWETTTAGSVWRLGIRSAKAYSIYLNFKTFDLINGARLFVYSPKLEQLRGGITSTNQAFKRLSTPPISGDSLILELDVPAGVSNFGHLQLSRVYHDVVGVFKKSNLVSTGVSADLCDQNINCENGIYWQTEKKAVCKIITDGALSTGCMMGNTAKGKQPYLITAYHTMFDSIHAADAVFIFNYENNCNQTTLHELQSLSGATIIASTPGMDYALLRLNDVPPPSFSPYYAGWDIRDNVPLNGVCIHHPGGKHTQIALDYHAISTASFGMGYLPNSSWKVERWDIGSTEPGSSGAPLFNQQHHLIGTLTGGYSSCNYQGSDFFNKLNTSWDASLNSVNSIKAALDPANSGAGVIDGYDPYGFNPGDCDTISQISATEKKVVSSAGLQWGYLSGNNSSGFSAFAEKFTTASSLLIPGFYIDVASLSYANPAASIEVKIWQGNNSPQKEIYHQTVFLKDLKAGIANYITLDSAVKVSSGFFIGYQINYNSPAYLFAVYHAADRGKRGSSSMYVFNGSWNSTQTMDPFYYSTSLAISITECYGRSTALTRNQLLLFPNPTNNYVDMITPDGFIVSDVRCYDISGHQHPVIFRPSEVAPRVFFDLQPGVYLLYVMSAGKQMASKFIVQNR